MCILSFSVRALWTTSMSPLSSTTLVTSGNKKLRRSRSPWWVCWWNPISKWSPGGVMSQILPAFTRMSACWDLSTKHRSKQGAPWAPSGFLIKGPAGCLLLPFPCLKWSLSGCAFSPPSSPSQIGQSRLETLGEDQETSVFGCMSALVWIRFSYQQQ